MQLYTYKVRKILITRQTLLRIYFILFFLEKKLNCAVKKKTRSTKKCIQKTISNIHQTLILKLIKTFYVAP